MQVVNSTEIFPIEALEAISTPPRESRSSIWSSLQRSVAWLDSVQCGRVAYKATIDYYPRPSSWKQKAE